MTVANTLWKRRIQATALQVLPTVQFMLLTLSSGASLFLKDKPTTPSWFRIRFQLVTSHEYLPIQCLMVLLASERVVDNVALDANGQLWGASMSLFM